MKRIFYILLFSCLLNTPAVLAQNSDTTSTSSSSTPDDDRVYTFVEEMAKFPGGENAMYAFIRNNVKYPKKDRKEKREGRVMAQFTVTSIGKIENIQILRGVSPTIDAEVIRVINLMPDWIPATQKGKPVNVKFNLPFNFKLP